jgi:hypothetical protein
MTESGVCLMCGEPVVGDGVPISTLEGLRTNHRECSLREVLGGIGHHIAHEWWCEIHHDPDAGFTRHQSALMVAFMYEMLGDEMIMRDPVTGVSARAGGEVAPPVSPASSDDEWGVAVLSWLEAEEPQEDWPADPPPPPASAG